MALLFLMTLFGIKPEWPATAPYIFIQRIEASTSLVHGNDIIILLFYVFLKYYKLVYFNTVNTVAADFTRDIRKINLKKLSRAGTPRIALIYVFVGRELFFCDYFFFFGRTTRAV